MDPDLVLANSVDTSNAPSLARALQAGASPYGSCDCRHPLSRAAVTGSLSCVQLLLGAGAGLCRATVHNAMQSLGRHGDPLVMWALRYPRSNSHVRLHAELSRPSNVESHMVYIAQGALVSATAAVSDLASRIYYNIRDNASLRHRLTAELLRTSRSTLGVHTLTGPPCRILGV